MTDMAALERVDSFPYRHRVAEVMGHPLVTARPTATIAEAARLMSGRSLSSLAVVDEAGRAQGIVTERDVIHALAGEGGAAVDLPLSRIMSSPVATVRADAFVYVAMGRMNRLRVRHLVAVDEAGVAVGMVTVGRLLHLRANSALVVGDEVECAADGTEMDAARRRLPRLAQDLLAEGVDGLGVAAVASSVLRDLTVRSARLAEAAMAGQGWGAAPAPWCLLLLGSGGRRESLFAADQDNALIHAGTEADAPWFAELGNRLCATLEQAGVPLCQGGVMARNAPWRHSLEGWRRRVDGWIREAEGPELLNIHIFVDFRPVHGEPALAADLRAHLTERAAGASAFLHAMAQSSKGLRAPLGVLGQFVTREGRLDMKASGLLPLTAAARVLALKHGIAATGTADRLAALAAGGHMAEEEARGFRDSLELMTRALIGQQLADHAAGLPITNRVDPKRLRPHERARLKEAFKSINALGWLMQNALSTV